MRINNQKQANIAKILLIRTPLLLALIILVLTLFKVINIPVLLISAAIVFALCLLTTLIFRLHYVSGEFSNNSIRIKYYHLFPLIREYRKIELSRQNLHTVSLEKRLAGQITILIISERTDDGIASYPEVPLSFFSKAQLSDINQILSSNKK